MAKRLPIPSLGEPPKGCTWQLRRVQHGGIIARTRGPIGHKYYLDVWKGKQHVYHSEFFVAKGDNHTTAVDKAAAMVLARF